MFSSFLGRVSRDYFICLSVIINYDFDLSVFIFPKSGVKIIYSIHLSKIFKGNNRILRQRDRSVYAFRPCMSLKKPVLSVNVILFLQFDELFFNSSDITSSGK